ncbi:hypothetical protein JCM11641_001543 [Rhodosporidiobolus odoratus]
MTNSIVYTAELPSFDSESGQLTLTQHHLISTPLSYLNSISQDYTLLLQPPPTQPYQSEQQDTDPSLAESPPRRKRRRRAPPSETSSPADWALHREKQERRTTTDRETEQHHASISLGLEAAIDAVRQGWSGQKKKEDGWMGDVGPRVEWIEKREGDELSLVELARRFPPAENAGQHLLRIEERESSVSLSHLFNRIVLNPSDNAFTMVELREDDNVEHARLARLLLPPSSGFLLFDFFSWSSPSSGIASLGAQVGGWDVVVIDPPWPNASATRSSSYETFDAYDLWKLDLPALLGDKPALVAVWLTNKVKFRRLVTEKLFPAWHIKPGAEWYWVKIASETGEPVWPLDAKHRRPYEGLVLGYYVPPKTPVDLPNLPQNKIFLSTPMGHSRKPIVIDLLRPYLLMSSKPPNVLELFARTTLSGFSGEDPTSSPSPRGTYLAVSNEAVKFNVLDEEGSGVKGWIKP